MRFLVMVKGNAESESGILPEPELFEEMGKFNEQMIKAGVMLAADGLKPTSQGARIRWQGGKRSVTDGPFTEAKELVAGFWIIQVKSKEEAVEWISRAPFDDGAEVEIRPMYEAEDFGELAPELREQEQRLQAQLAAKK